MLLPEVSSLASLLATFIGDSSSEVELSGELVLVLKGLLLGLGGEGDGGVAVEGRMALVPVLVRGMEGSGVEARAWME